jgi:hypothetical protein
MPPRRARSDAPYRNGLSHFAIAKTHFAMQSLFMENDWAAEHLQTIRTLMERSAVYRRALAPIMLFAGALGVIGAAVGLCFHLDSMRQFATMWLVTAILTVGGSFLIARRQAFKDSEPFWSPPTRRIAQALAPPLTVGMIIGLISALEDAHDIFYVVIFLWALFYGCAVHAAGFFISRGMRLFGWIYIGCAGILVFCHFHCGFVLNPHCLMGFFFGVLHLACGAYLFLTEKGKNAA